MGRKKKQGDIEDAIADKKGHNSQLTDDERRALTLHHKRLYEAADALVEKAKAERKAVADLAKSDLGKGAVADIKALIEFSDEKKAKAQIENSLRLARWSGLPVGTQVNMFDAPVDDRAAEEGKVAGMAGLPCEPPRHFPPSAHQRWISSWHEGQAVLASAFAKKREPAESTTTENEPAPPPSGNGATPSEAHA